MSLFESGDSTGEISLAALLDGHRPTARPTGVTVPRYAELVVRGGWPLNLTRTVTAAARANIDYVTTITEVDLPTIDPARRHPRLALRVLQSLARNIGMDYVVTRVAHDASTDDSDIARSTVYDYLAPLERLMVRPVAGMVITSAFAGPAAHLAKGAVLRPVGRCCRAAHRTAPAARRLELLRIPVRSARRA